MSQILMLLAALWMATGSSVPVGAAASFERGSHQIITESRLDAIAPSPDDTVAAVPLPRIRFDDAQAIEADPFGALYVADAARHVVVKLDTTGAVIERIGGPGSREGAFDRPMDVDPTNGLVLLVADAGNNRIQIFSRSHAYLGSIPLTGTDKVGHATYRRSDAAAKDVSNGIPIAVGSFGTNEIVAIDANRNLVLKWNENRRLARVIGDVDAGPGVLGEPISLWTDSESLIYVADRGRRSILVYDHYGSYVRTIGSGRLGGIVAVAGHDEQVYAATSDRIHVFSRRGEALRTLVPLVAEPLVDLAVTNGRIFALTATTVYRLGVEG